MTGGPVTGTGLSRLAAEFPGYEFGTQRTWGGISLIAVRRRDAAAQPGLYAVITADLDELRRTLAESELAQNPGPG